jgi:hypothetical protein
MPKLSHHHRHGDDLYEFVLDGFRISRITVFFSGSSQCKNVSYDNIPEEVKVVILDKVQEAIDNQE